MSGRAQPSGPPYSDAYADLTPYEPSRLRCQRPSCNKVLPPGISLYMLHDKQHTSDGFGVCPDCRIHYDNKGSGIVHKKRADNSESVRLVSRTEAGTSRQQGRHPAPLSSSAIAHIQKATAQANRGGRASAEPLRSPGAYPQHGLMAPPPVPSHRLPDVRIPGNGGPNSSVLKSLAPPGPSLGYGYTDKHAGYLEARAHLQQLAYAPTSDHRITLDLRGVIRKPGRVTPEIVADMFCVVDKVKASVGASDILTLAWTHLSPKWVEHTNNYPLSITECSIFTKDWVEITPRNPDVNVIAERFYKPNAKSPNQPHFKTGKMLINLCIPSNTYRAWEEYDTQQQMDQFSNADSDRKSAESEDESVAIVSRTTVQTRNRAEKPPSRSETKSQPLFLGASTASGSGSPANSALRPASFSNSKPAGKENSVFRHRNGLTSSNLENVDEDIVPASDTRTIARLPKHALIKALTQQTPPSRLEMGGLMKLTTIPVQASVAKRRTLSELLFDSANFDPKARRLQATLASLGSASKPLFGTSSTEICAKRTFYTEQDEGGIVHHIPNPSSRQATDLAVEVRCIAWSAALLEDVYEGIDNFIANAANTQLPIEIPRMRFVQVAFATEGKTGEPGRPRSVFLVEELIDEPAQGQFRKYINNRTPVPTNFIPRTENHNRALFLAFTQHWQFKRTHGLAFVSDYQGGNTLLTDPQVMSDEYGFKPFSSPLLILELKITRRYIWVWKYTVRIYGKFDPTDEDLPIAMSISRSALPVPSTKGKRKAEEEPEDSRSGSRRRVET
ncbi:hypothetical protein R3P38DRAFT_3179849 [Favolaschia claudopus]|uniref:Alpha-type protein kinase domain-containing protein n=1 Tax=Favolaschia claudopus TaxID=2862362 RepID=A0AAW0CMY7_9AGAR